MAAPVRFVASRRSSLSPPSRVSPSLSSPREPGYEPLAASPTSSHPPPTPSAPLATCFAPRRAAQLENSRVHRATRCGSCGPVEIRGTVNRESPSVASVTIGASARRGPRTSSWHRAPSRRTRSRRSPIKSIYDHAPVAHARRRTTTTTTIRSTRTRAHRVKRKCVYKERRAPFFPFPLLLFLSCARARARVFPYTRRSALRRTLIKKISRISPGGSYWYRKCAASVGSVEKCQKRRAIPPRPRDSSQRKSQRSSEDERESKRDERINARARAGSIQSRGRGRWEAMVVEWLCPGLRPTRSNRPRLLRCKVILLDEHELLQDVLSSNLGQELLDRVFKHLNLLETSYFGLRYLDHGNQTQWLDQSKKLGKQLKIHKGDPGSDVHTLYFGVKFYAADPCKLIEEITRYQFFLQIKQDILQGRLPVSFDLAAELGAYVVQSELGDYDPRRHSPGYVTEFRFLANQTTELENRIVEIHKTLIGQLPSAAELNYLDKVKWLEMYGVDLHPVLGEDSVEYFLGLTPSGIILLRNKTKVGNYYWPRINKIYYKGRYFMLRVSEKNSEERTHGFETPSKGACRHLWKCCLEHQAFFRLMATGPPPLSPYSRFHSYSPPSTLEKHAAIRRNPPPFQRTPSRRAQRRVVEGQEMVGSFVETPVTVISNPGNNPSNILCNTQRQMNTSSPRSTRSAPWTQSQPRGLYTSSSPRSVRSVGTAPALLSRLQRRSSSVESQSSGDSHSRSGHRRRSHSHSHRRHSRHSDCESELSRSSDTRSGHRKHRRKHRNSRSSRHELVDSEPQWREAQKRKGEGVQKAIVSHTEPRRRHRSRHRSPSQKQPLPDELRKHLEFGLVDTSGMSEQQRREISYTVVQSQSVQQPSLQSNNSRLDDTDSSSLPRYDDLKTACNLHNHPPQLEDETGSIVIV